MLIKIINIVNVLLATIKISRRSGAEVNGMFILTGSHQTDLRGAVAQSLAGRTAILHLLPMQHARI
jgi:predicted AAA+ superfamily ATPase